MGKRILFDTTKVQLYCNVKFIDVYRSYEFVMIYPFNRDSHFPLIITIYSLSHSQVVIIINAYGWSAHVSHYFMLSFQSAKNNKEKY